MDGPFGPFRAMRTFFHDDPGRRCALPRARFCKPVGLSNPLALRAIAKMLTLWAFQTPALKPWAGRCPFAPRPSTITALSTPTSSLPPDPPIKHMCHFPNPCPIFVSWLLLLTMLNGISPKGMVASPPESTERASFNRDVRPILSDLCFACHGPDTNHREADLRLDQRDGALSVIQVNDASASELVRRMLSHDDQERMPPPKSNRQPTKEQIEIIKRWIDQGAVWEEHWSFMPLIKPAIPVLDPSNASSIRNPIDAFIQSQLLSRGWKPALEADRRTLIRRVTLDLTGLPPTLNEVDDFVADATPAAYEKVVARLLQSSAFGERMAWDWLDAARYADTNGYQGDNERTMWPWRDWVVRAFNENLPFDQFTLWQLAGDMLPDATLEQKLATGFCRNHMINGEGGRIPEENRVDYVMDMTETMGTVWLGLTLNCCRCHDHKFDAIKQAEYYQLFAFFNQTPVDGGGGNAKTLPILAVPSQAQKSQIEKIDSQIQIVQGEINARANELLTQQPEWEDMLRQSPQFFDWKLATVLSATAQHQQLKIEDDRSVLASGENPPKDVYEIALKPETETVATIRLDALQHKSLTKNGLSRSDSGNFVLTSFEVYRERFRTSDETESKTEGTSARIPLKIVDAKATFEQGGHMISSALDSDSKTGWAVWEGRTVDRSHSASFYFEEPIQLHANERLVILMRHESANAQHNMGRFRLSTSSNKNATLDAFEPEFESALAKPVPERSKAERELLVQFHHQSDDKTKTLNKSMSGLKDQRKSVVAKIPDVMVMGERDKPRDTFLLNRGLYNDPGPRVTANVPASLPPLPTNSRADRLAMARWLVSNEQPLTARVIVNRFWQQFFGIGLVKTVEDFGSQGEIPRYLELHEWLATEFRDSGWDTKQLVQLIVTSHAYRQSSSFSDSSLATEDPENRHLARGPRFRMPSWMVRDQALAASGLLVQTMGGPAVNGYQPAGVWEEATFGNKKYKQDTGDSLYRRSLYTYWRRIIGPTMFFDNASRQVCTVKVVRTNTPLQALFTLNDVTFVEAARGLATQILYTPARDDAVGIDLAFQRVLARTATSSEKNVLLAGLSRSRHQFAEHPNNANSILAVGDSKAGSDLDRIELASWTSLCLAVLNLDETLTKE